MGSEESKVLNNHKQNSTTDMEVHARAPDPLSSKGDMAKNWHRWKEDFVIFMKVTGYINKPDEDRANILKNRIGKIGIDAIEDISFDNPQDRDNMDILIRKLEEYFDPPKNEIVERYSFFTMKKKQNESIEQYINDLKKKAETCNFKEMTDSLIRDQVILNIHDKVLREKLMKVPDLELSKLITIYNDYIDTERTKQVIRKNKTARSRKIKTTLTTSNEKPAENVTKDECRMCGFEHPPEMCPASKSKCTKCGNTDHFSDDCSFRSNLMMNHDRVKLGCIHRPPLFFSPGNSSWQ